MISCERAWELLSQQMDEPLSHQEKQELEEHLAVCPSCRKDQEELEQMKETLKGLEELQAPVNFTARVMAQVQMESQGKFKVIPLWRRPQVRALAGLAACALLCIGIYRFMPQGNNLNGGLVTSSQGPVSTQQPELADRSASQDATTSDQETDPGQTQENTVQAPAAQPRTADLAPDISNQSGSQTQQTAPYTADGSGGAQNKEWQRKAQTPQATAASAQTELVVSVLSEQAAALLPAQEDWSTDDQGNLSCTVSSQVLEQLCQLLDQEETEYTVTPQPWSETCIVRLG